MEPGVFLLGRDVTGGMGCLVEREWLLHSLLLMLLFMSYFAALLNLLQPYLLSHHRLPLKPVCLPLNQRLYFLLLLVYLLLVFVDSRN